MTPETDEEERRTGIERRNGFKLSTKLGSLEAAGEGMVLLLVIGMFGCAAGIFYTSTVVTQQSNIIAQQLISLEYTQRMTMCALVIPDTDERWTQFTQPNSACSDYARRATQSRKETQ